MLEVVLKVLEAAIYMLEVVNGVRCCAGFHLETVEGDASSMGGV